MVSELFNKILGLCLFVFGGFMLLLGGYFATKYKSVKEMAEFEDSAFRPLLNAVFLLAGGVLAIYIAFKVFF